MCSVETGGTAEGAETDSETGTSASTLAQTELFVYRQHG